MKKTLSILLSIVMLLSITAGLNFSAYANTSGDYEYEVLDDGTAQITKYNGNSSNLTIPSKLNGCTVTSIGDYVFAGCSKLTSVTIPKNVKSIGIQAFNGCECLANIYVDSNNKKYTSVNGIFYNKNKTELIRYPEGKNGTSFSIPNTVKKLSDDAFNSCLLRSVTIPDSVTSIGAAAFGECKKLTKITIPKNVKQIYCLAFYDCVKLKDITILSKNVVIEDYAFGYMHDTSAVYDDFSGGLNELPVKGCKIRGYRNSTAEKYAKANGITFNTIVSVALSATSYTYNGKVKKPSVTVKDAKGKKISSKYYTVSYSKGRKNVGQYTVTIKFKGNYSGTVKKTFTIKPKATTLSKVTAGKKAFTVKWKKQATQTTGYQIQYSTSSKFKSAKTVTVSKNKTTSKKISKLKAKKKYYVRIRTYKTVKVNGKNTKIYSGWSKAKTVKTK